MSGGVIMEAIIKKSKYIPFLLFRIKFFKSEVLYSSPNNILINKVFNKHILNIEAI